VFCEVGEVAAAEGAVDAEVEHDVVGEVGERGHGRGRGRGCRHRLSVAHPTHNSLLGEVKIRTPTCTAVSFVQLRVQMYCTVDK
jgi:hypothetical protein